MGLLGVPSKGTLPGISKISVVVSVVRVVIVGIGSEMLKVG